MLGMVHYFFCSTLYSYLDQIGPMACKAILIWTYTSGTTMIFAHFPSGQPQGFKKNSVIPIWIGIRHFGLLLGVLLFTIFQSFLISLLRVVAILALKSCRNTAGVGGAIFAADFFFPMVRVLKVDSRQVIAVDSWQKTKDREQ